MWRMKALLSLTVFDLRQRFKFLSTQPTLTQTGTRTLGIWHYLPIHPDSYIEIKVCKVGQPLPIIVPTATWWGKWVAIKAERRSLLSVKPLPVIVPATTWWGKWVAMKSRETLTAISKIQKDSHTRNFSIKLQRKQIHQWNSLLLNIIKLQWT